MYIQALRPDLIMPTKGSPLAAAWDIYMPEAGQSSVGDTKLFGLGFATALPEGWAALLLPRSSTGAKFSVELNNTLGLIDADYRGEWKAAIRTKTGIPFKWEKNERVLQFILVPHHTGQFTQVAQLPESSRGTGGFGSTGV